MQVCFALFPECRYVFHFFPSLRTKDGIATPFQLGKKSAQCTLSVMHFVFRFRMLYFILFYLHIYVANAFRTSVYGTLVANYLRWVVILSCLHFRYGVAVTLVVPFLCERK